jgi:Putative auto-transporter adhesin, head GIN domain
MKRCVLIVLAGCSWIGVEGSGKPTREVRPVTGFSAIDISSAINAEIAIGAAERVEISGDDNLVPLVATEVNGKRLVIETRKRVRPKLPLVARITALRLGALDVSGSSNVALHGVHEDRLALDLSGSAVIRGDGTVGQLDIDVSGSGSLELDQLAAERASVTVSGSGNVVLAVSRALDVHISGSATVTYRGDPEVKQDISGSGRLVKR